jgi:ABC-type dipeptide/oligopeptide/nickel transport system permease component
MIEFRGDTHEAAAPHELSAVDAPGPLQPRRQDAFRVWAQRNRWWMLRTLVLPLHVALFATISFFLVRLVPGDPVLARMDTSGSFNQADYDAAAESMGLNGSLLNQFGTFWNQLLHLDLGTSQVTGRPIWEELISRLPSTIELVLLGLVGAIALSLLLALVTLFTSNVRVHRLLASYGKLAGAVPDFALAILGLVLFYTILRVIPAPIGRTAPGLSPVEAVTGFPLLDALVAGNGDVFGSIVSHYVLPVAVYTPNIWKQLSLGVEEQAASAPSLFKIASGATRGSIYRSILRRASASSVVMIGSLFGGLVGGVVVLEQLFGLGGVGQFAITSVDNIDFLGLQGFLVVIAAICLVAYFVVDILNMLLDPRRRPGARTDS